MIAFRVDASTAIGSGHLMRCLTLANALAQLGRRSTFLSADLPGALHEHVVASGHRIVILPRPAAFESNSTIPHAAWLGCSAEDDAAMVRPVLEKLRLTWLVVDHYALDASWERAVLPNGARLMVIDDLADRPHRADLLLDQTLGRRASDYDALLHGACEILVGPGFGLLRPEFARLRAGLGARSRLGRILVAMGGVDAPNVTERALRALARRDGTFHVDVVLGSRAPHAAAVRAQAALDPRVERVLFGTDQMAELMAEADLSIGAVGTSSWERCCLGLPCLMIILAANQREAAHRLEATGAARLLGDAGDLSDIEVRIDAALDALSHEGALQAMSRAAASICDGDGVARVVGRL